MTYTSPYRYEGHAPDWYAMDSMKEALATLRASERREPAMSLRDRKYGNTVAMVLSPDRKLLTIQHLNHPPLSEGEREETMDYGSALIGLRNMAREPGACPERVWDHCQNSERERVAQMKEMLEKRNNSTLRKIRCIRRDVRRVDDIRCKVVGPEPVAATFGRVLAAETPEDLMAALKENVAA